MMAGRLLTSADESEHPTLSSGTQLGAYRISKFLGAGGTADVYRAQPVVGPAARVVAIKIARNPLPEDLERWQHERAILTRLEHPHIAALYDGGVALDGRPYLVMEFVSGIPLRQWCLGPAASLQRRIRLFEQLCETLGFIHRQRVAHADLTPSNILVSHDGHMKLIDFGAARSFDAGAHHPCRGMTPDYAAPELLRGQCAGAETDMFALGLLLLELMIGAKPRGLASLPLALLVDRVAHPSSASRRLRCGRNPLALPPAVADAVSAIAARAMHAIPARRYSSVFELQAEIATLHRAAGHTPRASVCGESSQRWTTALHRRSPSSSSGRSI